MAQGWYQQGTRILDVRNPRNIKQVGYFFTGAMETWAAYWVPVRNGRGQVTDKSSNLVYTVDAVRGIDVLRVGLPSDQSPRDTKPKRAPILPQWVAGTTPVASRPGKEWGWLCRLAS